VWWQRGISGKEEEKCEQNANGLVCNGVEELRKKEFRVQLEAQLPDVGAPVDVGKAKT
jgi:hypothetical protein